MSAQTDPQPGTAADPVAATVAAEWATYDADRSGSLSKAEFTKWMVALREKAPAPQPVADVSAWANAAFAQADADRSKSVSQDELQRFLRG
jgi:Ca2+-binding EF-hand superfamily protein